MDSSFQQHHFVATAHEQYLTDEEVAQFVDTLDTNKDGFIDYDEIERRLNTTYAELFPQVPQKSLLGSIWRRARRSDTGNDSRLAKDTTEADVRQQFLRSIIGSDARCIPRDEFAARVKEWKIPSLKLEQQGSRDCAKSTSLWRQIRAYWTAHGPEILFIVLVVSLQVVFGAWQLHKYATGKDGGYVLAFGWGVVMSKTCAGALYPTMFFLVLSMSRYCSTFLRSSYYLSRFINFDLSQSFHIKISVAAVILSTLHAIGHLTGTFNNGSNPEHDRHVNNLLGNNGQTRSYSTYLFSLPGWTGLVALLIFYTLGIVSSASVRRHDYEVFQLGHLLIYPLLALLAAHGSVGLLQYPMLGYWLAIPTMLVLTERIHRLVVGFHRIPATLRLLDGETAEITVDLPSRRLRGYKPGQYVLLQVPKLSFFQWHPFTVSVCEGTRIQLHVKTDGNWTKGLRSLASDSGPTQIEVGINGPFGAPAQRFYDFSHTIVIGSGIGVTPFSGILSDLQARDNAHHGGPGHVLDCKYMYPFGPRRTSVINIVDRCRNRRKPSLNFLSPLGSPPKFAPDYRRVDFHWTVRERNYLLWMAELLNDVSRSQQWHRRHDHLGAVHLDIRINTHVTQRRSSLITHVYCWLLEMYRTESHPESPLTHLLNPTHLGRPNFVRIMDQHYEEMLAFQVHRRAERERRQMADGSGGEWPFINTRPGNRVAVEDDEVLKVGVFFCGNAELGEVLVERCQLLTARSMAEGTKVEYRFIGEVFT